jgi:dihydrofolate reductase
MVTCHIAMSIDGFVAGPNQSLENPIGEGGMRLHRWMFEQAEANQAVIDDIVSAKAYIMGRNMFAPDRGDWDLDWQGWWGEDPPYHAPVFVLTHHAREPLTMLGGTTFTFVTGGIESALEQANAVAGDGHVSIAGGGETVRSYLAAGAIDELNLHVAPIVLGAGERLFDGLGGLKLEQPDGQLVTHVSYRVSR